MNNSSIKEDSNFKDLLENRIKVIKFDKQINYERKAIKWYKML